MEDLKKVPSKKNPNMNLSNIEFQTEDHHNPRELDLSIKNFLDLKYYIKYNRINYKWFKSAIKETMQDVIQLVYQETEKSPINTIWIRAHSDRIAMFKSRISNSTAKIFEIFREYVRF